MMREMEEAKKRGCVSIYIEAWFGDEGKGKSIIRGMN